MNQKVDLKEMNKLVHLLADAKIDFEIHPRLDALVSERDIISTFSIVTRNNHGRMIVGAICNPFSYGWQYQQDDGRCVNLIEVMAHDEYAEVTDNDVVGYCTAEEAFEIFQKVWKMAN